MEKQGKPKVRQATRTQKENEKSPDDFTYEGGVEADPSGATRGTGQSLVKRDSPDDF